MKNGTGKFVNRRVINGRNKYDKFFIYLPTELGRDSAFPFKDGDKLKIEIVGKRVSIEKM